MSKPGSKGVIHSKDQANRQLSFAIRILQGQICHQSWKGKLQIALIIRDRLLESGWVFQARRVENWIHRLQPRRADSERAEEGS
jgi:hypothetical protein